MRRLVPFLSIALIVALSCDASTPAAPELPQAVAETQGKAPGSPPGLSRGLAGYEIISYDWVIASCDEDTWILECPAGKKALGAGFQRIGGSLWELRESYPAELPEGIYAYLWRAWNGGCELPPDPPPPQARYRIFVTCAS